MRPEGRSLASLHHRDIAGLLDGDTTEDGPIWFTMEPVRGLRERAAAMTQRPCLFLQVCDAVRFVHLLF